MANWAFTQGVHDIGNGLYGYVQPDGTWGWSNAGLVVSDGETLLVDTLMSVPLTREMLDQFKARVPAAAHIGRLVTARIDDSVPPAALQAAQIHFPVAGDLFDRRIQARV